MRGFLKNMVLGLVVSSGLIAMSAEAVPVTLGFRGTIISGGDNGRYFGNTFNLTGRTYTINLSFDPSSIYYSDGGGNHSGYGYSTLLSSPTPLTVTQTVDIDGMQQSFQFTDVDPASVFSLFNYAMYDQIKFSGNGATNSGLNTLTGFGWTSTFDFLSGFDMRQTTAIHEAVPGRDNTWSNFTLGTTAFVGNVSIFALNQALPPLLPSTPEPQPQPTPVPAPNAMALILLGILLMSLSLFKSRSR